MLNLRITVTAAACAGLLALAPAPADAAGYCSDLSATGLSTADATFGGAPANDCYGVGSGQPSLADLNDLSLFGGDWEALVKDDGRAGTINYLGLNWTLDAPNGGTGGGWTLSAYLAPGGTLPVVVDLVAVLKGSSSWAAYLFTAETFSLEGGTTGKFKVAFSSRGGQIPDLSSMSIGFRTATVPEPGSLLLLALGFGTLASARKLQARRARP